MGSAERGVGGAAACPQERGGVGSKAFLAVLGRWLSSSGGTGCPGVQAGVASLPSVGGVVSCCWSSPLRVPAPVTLGTATFFLLVAVLIEEDIH